MAKRHTPPRIDEPSDRFVIETEVCGDPRATSGHRKGILPYHRTTVYRKVRAGTFPAPIQLSPGRKGWWLSTIRAWVRQQEAQQVASRAYFGRDKARALDLPPSP
jgi:hypothetical protein